MGLVEWFEWGFNLRERSRQGTRGGELIRIAEKAAFLRSLSGSGYLIFAVPEEESCVVLENNDDKYSP